MASRTNKELQEDLVTLNAKQPFIDVDSRVPTYRVVADAKAASLHLCENDSGGWTDEDTKLARDTLLTYAGYFHGDLKAKASRHTGLLVSTNRSVIRLVHLDLEDWTAAEITQAIYWWHEIEKGAARESAKIRDAGKKKRR